MAKELLTVRIELEVRDALDAIATVTDRDRTYVVNEALRAYIDVHRWQVKHIRQGLREAESGNFVSDVQVKKTIARLTRK